MTNQKPFKDQKNVNQLIHAIEQIGEGVALFDTDDRLVFYNESWWEMNNAAYKTTKIGTTFEDHIRALALLGGIPEALGRVEEWVAERVEKHQNPKGLFEMPREDGRWQQVNEQRLEDGSIILVVLDITEVKNRENELRVHRDRLEQMVQDRTSRLTSEISDHKMAARKLTAANIKLNQTQAELVQSEKMASLGGLVAGVAHEINTPIGVSLTAASYLEEITGTLKENTRLGTLKKSDFDGYLTAAAQSTQIISANLKRAADLIGSFKQVAVDQSSQDRRKFRISPYLDEILMTLNPNLKQHNHEIAIDCDPTLEITSYPGAFSQVITNLIMNSLIHGFEGTDNGKIRISVTDQETDVLITYADNGCGMSDDARRKIFDPFFTTKRGRGGSGLGMNILFNLVTQTFKGSVSCASELGNGVIFQITLNKETPQETLQ